MEKQLRAVDPSTKILRNPCTGQHSKPGGSAHSIAQSTESPLQGEPRVASRPRDIFAVPGEVEEIRQYIDVVINLVGVLSPWRLKKLIVFVMLASGSTHDLQKRWFTGTERDGDACG